jgi:hypothetical protein
MVKGFEPNSKESFRPGGAKLAGREKKGHGGGGYRNETEKTEFKNFSNFEVSGRVVNSNCLLRLFSS